MGSLTESNLIALDTPLKTGQRCIRIGDHIIPVGVGGMYEPAAGTSSDSAAADIILGVVDANGNFQPLSFNGTQASNSGSALVVQNYKTWNSTLPAPEPTPSPVTSMDFYKCTYVNSDSWGGYKVSINDGIYTYQSNSTGGLTYSSLTPAVNQIYNANCTVMSTPVYKPLNYIQSTGQQVINSQILCDNSLGMEIYGRMAGDTGNYPCVVGSIGTWQVDNLSAPLFNEDNNIFFIFGSVAQWNQSPDWLSIGVNFVVSQNLYNDRKVWINNTQRYQFASDVFPADYVATRSVYIFGKSTQIFAPATRIYNVKLTKGSTLVRDFIPVLDPHNTACLFDKVSKRFFYDLIGTTPFVYG